MRRTSLAAWVFGTLLVTAAPALAQETVTLILQDGSALVGRILEEDAESLTFQTEGGIELRIERVQVASVRRTTRARRDDPNDSRLMLAPTGRQLRKGDGYFSDHYVLFPGFGYGLTDWLSIGGGVSVVPGVGLDEQLFYVSPQVGRRVSERFALAGGALVAGSGDYQAALLFGVGTFGGPGASLTLGLGVGGTRENGYERFRWRDRPILLLGGSARLSDRLALVSENWILVGEPVSQQPIGLALRFLGDRLSADVGFVFSGETLDEGVPVPWLSVSYHFGPSRRLARRAGRG